MAAQQFVTQIREKGSTESLPDGWVAMPLRWRGRDMEVVYNARHHKVMRAGAGQMDRDGRRLKAEKAGWHHVFTDNEGAELWVAEHADLARGRLAWLLQQSLGAHLAAGAEMRGPGLS